ncbi:MAG: hypothetical protein AAF694_20300 [Bacteroidota bacterium]
MRKLGKIGTLIVGVMVLLTGIWHALSAQSLVEPQPISSTFSGSILAASDADMIATAYANGVLNKVEGIEDTLSYLHIENGTPVIDSRVHASNSVISWPAIVEWYQPKKYAYVAETRGIYAAEPNKMQDVFSDFPDGQRITVVDYQDARKPIVVQDTFVGKNLQSVSMNHAGTLLAAGTTEQGKELMIATLREGLIDKLFYFTESKIDPTGSQDRGVRTVEFHPNKNILGVNLNGTGVAFYKVIVSESDIQIARLGNTLTVGKKLSVGNWHPSGEYFLISDVAWGNGALGYIFNGKGKLLSVKFEEAGVHSLVSSVKVGLSPEGFDISPDGTYAIAVNMRRTFGPRQFWFIPGRTKSSLSLVKIDPQNGQLERVGKQYGFEGALPEDAVFDLESNSIAVAVYQEQDIDHPRQGWIDFWEIREEQLVKTQTRVWVTRGVHNLLLIP